MYEVDEVRSAIAMEAVRGLGASRVEVFALFDLGVCSDGNVILHQIHMNDVHYIVSGESINLVARYIY